jgi:acyl phosphate:glycerol-3-phosphate acyltransferase
MINLLMLFFAYLIGSVSSAVLVCKQLGLPDPRSEGSHNPGATNVLRIGGKKAALLVLAGDIGKGIVAVLLARMLGSYGLALALTMLMVFLGHVFPLFMGFKGGKGVATLGGAVLALSPILGLIAVAIWLAVAYVSKYSSLAALVSTVSVLLMMLVSEPLSYTFVTLIVALLIIWRHWDNIQRLKQGTEPKISFNK